MLGQRRWNEREVEEEAGQGDCGEHVLKARGKGGGERSTESSAPEQPPREGLGGIPGFISWEMTGNPGKRSLGGSRNAEVTLKFEEWMGARCMYP